MTPAARWALRAAALAGAASLAWVSGHHALANVTAIRAPTLAVSLVERHSQAQAARADYLAVEGVKDAGTRDEAMRRARLAVDVEPGNARALRVLAQGAEQRWWTGDAPALYRASQAASRRDLATQVALLRERAAAGDMAGAARHADIAMRSSPQGNQLILPVLARTLSDARMIAPLSRVLAGDPSWTGPFWEQLASTPAAWPNVPALMARLKATGVGIPAEPGRLLILRMAYDGRFDAADATLGTLVPGRASDAATLANALGVVADPVPPYDWDLAADGRVAAELLRDGGLLLETSRGSGGPMARRLLRLAPGTYRLSMTMNIDAGGQAAPDAATLPFLRFACADPAGAPKTLRFANVRPVASADGAHQVSMDQTVAVPSGCSHQWLELAAPARDDSTSVVSVVRALRIVRI